MSYLFDIEFNISIAEKNGLEYTESNLNKGLGIGAVSNLLAQQAWGTVFASPGFTQKSECSDMAPWS